MNAFGGTYEQIVPFLYKSITFITGMIFAKSSIVSHFFGIVDCGQKIRLALSCVSALLLVVLIFGWELYY